MPESNLFDLFKKLQKNEDGESQDTPPFMIVGLGNPGREYEKNRHNVGFMAVDHFIDKRGFSGKAVKSKAVLTDGTLFGKKLYLVKPQTYMNLSGEAVGALMRFYKIPTDHLIVIHDDLDLPFGTIRIRPGGGAGGQKGVNSIIQRLGTKEFHRMRMGIGRPPGRMDPADYVLQNFSKDESEELPFLFNKVVDILESWISFGIDRTMNEFNGSSRKEDG